MSNNLIKTKNNNLQNQLNEWIEICQEINLLELNSNERNNKIKEFCIKFVPRDITIEECNEYANNIAGDEVYLYIYIYLYFILYNFIYFFFFDLLNILIN